MAGHRNAISFRPTQPTINVTRKFVKPKAAKAKPSIFAAPLPVLPQIQLPMLQGIAKLKETPKPIEVKPEEEIVEEEQPVQEQPVQEEPVQEQPVQVDPDNYGLNKEPGNTTYTIKKGDTWWALAAAKYEGIEGIPKNVLGRYLAAANSTQETPEEKLKEAKNGIIFFPGQEIQLPSEININGKVIKLKEDHAEHDVGWVNTNFNGQGTHLNIKITQIGPSWVITKNGEVVDDLRFNNENDAKAKVKELNDAAQAAVSSGTGTVSGDKAA